MSEIPVISITQECSGDEIDVDEISKLNINEALTDTEDLFMDQDTVRYRKGSASPKITGNSLIDAIVPTTNGSVTDVEDCTDSEDEIESEQPKSAQEADIALDSFLDQGYVDEMTKSSNKGDKPKTLTRCFSKASESNSLKVFADSTNALTDCEDCALSDDDDSLGDVSIPDCPEDILMKDTEKEAVDIHNSMKRKQEKHVHHKQEAIDESSSESDNDCKVRHRRGHRKPEERPRSDYENFSLSDDDMEGACAAKPSNRRSALFEAEELVMEESDVEDEKTQTFPEINITFVSEMPDTPTETTRSINKRPTSLSVAAPNADEALTDVENLDSSDSEDEKATVKRLMPRAVVRPGRFGGGGTTDVEDFNDSDDNAQDDLDIKREVGQEFLPSPVREIAILSQADSGEQKQNVMPLNQGLLMVRTPDIEQALTDVEDMSDAEETGEMYDSSKYTIESLPEMENGDVYSSDNTCVKTAKLQVMSPAQEPKTDTEDLFFERSTSNSGTGSELRRRRKPKHSMAAGNSCQQYKGKKFLEMKVETAATATTDVEDMYMSDDAKDCGFAPSKQRRATIQFSGLTAPSNDCDAKTDVEFLSGDELVNDHRGAYSPQLCFDGYASVIKARERNGLTKSDGLLDGYAIPLIRKVSPSPDTHNCNTDSEDMQGVSDEEEHLNGSYSRAQTATPYELTRALDESAGCEIHESSARVKGVLLDVKGMTGGDQQDMHTDVEYLDEDAGNGVDQ
ncbi:AAEL011574-PA [Aedes aegypti]|uniref:AAEL011574-PA n=1 Tax=Aedes aegypti TaxID=7159 RepID=Q16PQ0_AEDAE|nr:AAEL011574-PA [Aedes aegypti]